MNKYILALAAVAATAALAPDASAQGCNGPHCQAPPSVGGGGLFGRILGRQPMPAFQAAPWYLYWPYNAHFMTPAPLQGAYYAPPTGGGMVNPYFQSYPAAPAGPVAPVTIAPK